MSVSDEQLGQVQRLLKSDKQKDRKDGVKLLDSLLDSRDCLERLNRRTACLWPEDKIPVPSWPGVLDMYINFLSRELQASAGKRKPMDSLFLRVLKKLLQLADNEQRCGRRDNLLRRAHKLFVHIRDAISSDGALTSQAGLDYATLLRNQLLSNAKYCQQSIVVVFQDMLDSFHSRIEQVVERSTAGSAVPSDELLRLATSVQLLFQQMPGTLTPLFREDSVAFFAIIFKWLDERRDVSRVASLLLQSLLQVLLESGRDVCQHVPKLQLRMQNYFRHAWRETRNAKHKELLVNYMRAVLQLGCVSREGVIETLALISTDIEADGFKWEPDGKGDAAAAQAKYQHALMALAASLHYHKAQAPAEPEALDEDEHLPRKRRRTAPPHSQLIDAALDSPTRWGPVLAAMLHLHGHSLPPAAFQAALAGLTARLGSALGAAAPGGSAGSSKGAADAARASGSGGVHSQQLLWLLRIARELALAWPVELHPGSQASETWRARAAIRNGPGDASSTDAQQWQCMWSVLVEAMSVSPEGHQGRQSPALPGSCTDIALWLLQALLQGRIVTVPAKSALAARLAPLGTAPLNNAALAVVAELFDGEPCSSQPEADGRERLLQLCVQSLAHACSSGSGAVGPLLGAVSALIGGSRARIAAAAAALEAGDGQASTAAAPEGGGSLAAPWDAAVSAAGEASEAAQWWVLDADTARLDAQIRDLESTQELLSMRLAHTMRLHLYEQLETAEAQQHSDSSGSSGSDSSQHAQAESGQVPVALQLQGRLASTYAARLCLTLQALVASVQQGDVADEGRVCQTLAACAAAAAVVADAQQFPAVAAGAEDALVALAKALVEVLLQAGQILKDQVGDPAFAGRPLRLLRELAGELVQLQLQLPKALNGEPVPLVQQLTQAVGNGPVNALRDVVLEAVAAAAAATSRPGSANGSHGADGPAVMDYDEDEEFATLDLVKDAAAAAGQATGTTGSAAGTAGAPHANAPLGSGRELWALKSLTALAPAAAAPVAAVVLRLWQEVRRQSAVPAEEVQVELAQAMVAAVCAGGAWDAALPAMRMLGVEQGLLSGRPKDTTPLPRLHLVLQLLERLLLAGVAQGKDLSTVATAQTGSEGEGGTVLEAVTQLLVAIEDRLTLAQELNVDPVDNSAVDPSPPALQLQLGVTTAALLRASPPTFASVDSPVAHLLPRLGQLLDCAHAATRRAAAPIAAARIVDEAPPAIGAPPALARLQGHLQLSLTRQLLQGAEAARPAADEQGGPSASELGDSAVLQMVDLAAAAPELEAAALQMLCCHAARTPNAHKVVQAAMNLMAAQRHYCQNCSASSTMTVASISASGSSSGSNGGRHSAVDAGRAAYLRFHALQLLWSWFECGLTLQHLLSIKDLMTSSEVTDATFLASLAPHLLIAMFRADSQPLLDELSEILQTEKHELGMRYLPAILGAFLPRLTMAEAASVNRALQGSCMMSCMDEQTLERLTVESVAATLEHMLLLAAQVPTPAGGVQIGAVPAAPFFSTDVVVKSGRNLKEHAQTHKSRYLLSPKHVQALLLTVHRHVLSASHHSHKARSLGALRALIELLGPESAEPATARYALHILLQLLPVPELQVACCAQLLHLVNIVQTAAAPADGGNAATANGKKVAAAAAAAAAAQALQAQEAATALLGELLPSMVSVLVQCLEARVLEREALTVRIAAGLSAATLGRVAAARRFPLSAGRVASDSHSMAEDALLNTLLSLTVQAPVSLHPYLATVEPLPSLPSLPQLQPARELQANVRRRVQLPQELSSFAERAASMTPAARRRALQALLAGLQLRRQEIMQQLPVGAGGVVNGVVVPALSGDGQCGDGTGGESSGSDGGGVRPDVVAAAWRLARLAAELDDAGMSSLAGELLAAAGPLDPLKVAFDIPGAADGADGADGALGGGVGSGGSSVAVGTGSLGGPGRTVRGGNGGANGGAVGEEAGVQLPELLGQVLVQLGQCLVEGDVQLIGVVQRTLLVLLHASEARAALTALTEGMASEGSDATQQLQRLQVLQRCLQVYAPEDEAATLPDITGLEALGDPQSLDSEAQTAAAAVAAAVPVDAPELWRPAAKGYERWLCDLCSVLLRHCAGAPLLRLLASAAALRPTLAELLLPHALQEVISASSGGGAGDGLPKQLELGVLGAVECDLRAVRVVLRALEQLRHAHRDALVAANGAPPQDTRSPFFWRRCYCLDLSYLVVAQAAMRCSAYFTALLYVEMWCEEAHSRLTLTAGTAASADQSVMGFLRQLQGGQQQQQQQQQGQQQRQEETVAEQLLLDFYSNVSDPDGIYAVVALMGSPAAQLQLLRHEGSWARVLSGHDLLLQSGDDAGATQGGMDAVSVGPSGQGMARAGHTHGLLSALQHLGCLHTAQQYLAAREPQGGQQDPVLSDAQHELSWRLSQWQDTDLALAQQSQSKQHQRSQQQPHQGGSFNEAVLGALRALQSGDQDQFQGLLQSAGHSRVQQLASISAESAASVNPTLLQLQMLQMLRRAWPFKWPAGASAAAGSNQLSSDELLRQLQGGFTVTSGQVQGSEYRSVDLLQCLQSCVLTVLNRPDALAQALQASATSARKAGQYTAAEASLGQLRQLLLRSSSSTAAAPSAPAWVARMARVDAPWLLECAKLLWAQGQAVPAIKAVHSLVQGMQALAAPAPAPPPRNKRGQQAQQQQQQPQQQQVEPLALAHALAVQGKWVAQAHYEGTSAVGGVLEALKAASELAAVRPAGGAGGSGSVGAEDLLRCKVFFRLASYADERYRDAVRQRNSPEWRIQLGVVARKREEAATLIARTREQGLNDAARKYAANMVKKLEKQAQLDEAVIKAVTANEASCRAIALANYTACLLAGPTHDLPVVFRLCQLWFEQSDDPQVNAALAAAFAHVPSHKFVPLVYQIASRLSLAAAPGGFQSVLADALVRLGCDHPYHSLYQLFALRNGNLGADGKPNKDNILMSHTTDLDKLNAARIMLERIANHGPRSKEIIRQMDVLVAAYVELAAAKVPPNSVELVFPSGIRRRMSNLDQVPVVSVQLPVDPSCKYEGLPTIKDFQSRITFAGGINAPKVIRCIDDRGALHRQLVKSGNDDLRQDAIMQQFFGLVNSLLAARPVTARRRLGMGTYKVVPFSPAAGLVEWVEHTLPLTQYLIGNTNRDSGAHARYRRPGDWDFLKCHKYLLSSEPEQLRQRFEECCAHFPPVLHHFFLEAFPAPAHWFEARTNYARATAVSSMAGYVLGLGDRHSGNILLDVRTARVIHIDLGIAFEQGRLLNTAEVVPFRLTQDIVDGFGANGVEGAMRRCCEATLQVLRSSRDALLTVVGVVLHDPLYKWAMTPIKARRRQQALEEEEAGQRAVEDAAAAVGDGSNELGNADAERAVLRVKQKLEGVDGGEGEPRGVEGQVQALLQEAQDPERLCRMYVGWAPFM